MLHGGWSRRAVVVCGLVSAGCLFGAQGAVAMPIVAPLAGSPFIGSGNPYTVAFSPSGKLVATANQSGTVSMFSVSAGGALTPVAGSPVTMAGTSPSAQSLSFSPDGTLLAVADPSVNAVDVLSVSAGGVLTQVANSPFYSPVGSDPQAVAFSPNGQLLAIANVGLNTVITDRVSGGQRSPGCDREQRHPRSRDHRLPPVRALAPSRSARAGWWPWPITTAAACRCSRSPLGGC